MSEYYSPDEIKLMGIVMVQQAELRKLAEQVSYIEDLNLRYAVRAEYNQETETLTISGFEGVKPWSLYLIRECVDGIYHYKCVHDYSEHQSTETCNRLEFFDEGGSDFFVPDGWVKSRGFRWGGNWHIVLIKDSYDNSPMFEIFLDWDYGQKYQCNQEFVDMFTQACGQIFI